MHEIQLGELYDVAWRGFRANVGAFVGACISAFVLTMVAMAPVFAILAFAEDAGWLDPAGRLAVEWGGNALLALLIEWQYLGFVRMCLAAVRGQPVASSDIFRSGDALVPGLVTGVLCNALTLFGACLCVVPMFVVACAVALAQVFVVDKGLLPVAAIRASVAATKGRRWMVFVLGALGYLMLFAGTLALVVGLLVAVPMFVLTLVAFYERTWPTARPDA